MLTVQDYFNGDHLKQELMIHRESVTGDAVQLNMLHGTHFQARSKDDFAAGKTWGPWLWYLNNGSSADAISRAKAEITAWPYPWFNDAHAFQSRGSLSGRIALSDGRPASGAAIFLGDNRSNVTTLDQGVGYYYRTYADAHGAFSLAHVRDGHYTLTAWPNGGSIGDVTAVFSQHDVRVTAAAASDLGNLTWHVPAHKLVWQIGAVDRKATGFGHSGAPHEHARATKCPANLTFTVGQSKTSDWCFVQSLAGTWTVRFNLAAEPLPSPSPSVAAVAAAAAATVAVATLSIALAGYSSGLSSNVTLNGAKVGDLTRRTIGPGDPALYRSGTLAGEWHLVQFPVSAGVLRSGWNELDFQIDSDAGGGQWSSADTKISSATPWKGLLFDSILLEQN
jgi:rhamnogalacturonan endolyase